MGLMLVESRAQTSGMAMDAKMAAEHEAAAAKKA